MHGPSHIKNIIIIIHLKYFAVSDWLKLSPRLILYKQSALTKMELQYTIDSTIHLPGNEVDPWYLCLETRLLE